MTVGISVLTYQRAEVLQQNLEHLQALHHIVDEIIVVDNSPDDNTEHMVCADFPHVRYIRNDKNEGVAGRNRGFRESVAEIVITLDDDVIGLDKTDIDLICSRFSADPALGAICFKVLHHETGAVCNWCHPRRQVDYCDKQFKTYEISEGAVAFRSEAVAVAGGYYEPYFISHEGKDLAYRMMNAGYTVEYDGRISVIHHHDQSGRPDWRRYYYDTRNAIWLAARNMPVLASVRFISTTMAAMAIFSIRDRKLGPFSRGVLDGIRGLSHVYRTREVWSRGTRNLCTEIDREKPSIIYMIRLRLFRRGIQI